jgi:sporulation-control protein spo0M
MASDWLKKVGKVVRVTAETTAEVVRDTAVATSEAVRTTAGVGVGSIAVDLVQTGYKPGDKITGTLTLKLEEATPAERLVVRLSATGSRTRHKNRNGEKALVHEKETLYSFDLEVDDERTYPAGESNYNFSLRIPTDANSDVSIPDAGILTDVVKVASAFSRGVSHPTKWTVRAFLHIPWKRNIKKDLAIQVAEEEEC